MILKLFKKYNGYLQSKQLNQNRSLYYALQVLLKKGEVEKLRRGLYKHHQFATLNHWQEITLLYPKAVLCMHSACAYYQLTTYMPHTVHLAIENKRKITLAPYPPVQLYYWSKKYVTKHVVCIKGVKIYTLERTVCDAIKFENQIGIDVVKEVAKNYLSHKEKNIDKLLKTAKEIGAYDKVYKVFEILI